MSDLRARLAAKAVRRVVVPIAVADPTEQEAALQAAHTRLALLGAEPSEEAAAKAQADLDAARAAYDECFADVVFHALGADEYEALLEHYAIDDPDLDPERDDTVRWDDLLPDLLAASAEDDGLRDPDWWAEQLAKPEWSQGDKLDLRSRLVRINMEVPAKAPKG